MYVNSLTTLGWKWNLSVHEKATWGKTLKTRCTCRHLSRGKYKKENTKNLAVPLDGMYNPRYQQRVSMYEERGYVQSKVST